MLVPDDTTAAGQRRAESAQPESPSAGAGVVITMSTLSVAPAVDAEPVAAVAGALPPRGAPAGAAAREEPPPCLRDHLLPMLNLPSDLPAHFIGEKTMRRGDVSQCHQRLFLPGGNGGSVLRRLLEILNPEELISSVETGEGAKRKRMEAAEAQAQAQCGGLPVKLVSHRAGAVESRIMRLRTVDATVIWGRGYLEFVRRCGFKESDVVEIWAFRGTSTSSGCVDDCSCRSRCGGRSPLLHVLITKKDEQMLCTHCSLPMCSQ